MYNSDDNVSVRSLGLTFIRFYLSRNFVRLASVMFSIYYMWILIVKYDSIFLVSLIPTLSLAGYLAVLIPEGYVLDRFNRKTVMFTSSAASLAVYLLLFVSQSLLTVYTAALLSAVFSSISSDAFLTLMKETVDPKAMGKGMSLVQAGRAASEIAGIALGGLSIVLISTKFTPLVAAMAAVSAALSIPKKERSKTANNKKYGYSNVFKIIRIIVPFLLIGLLLNGLFVSLTVYSSALFYKILHVGPTYYTLFELFFSVGSLVGGLVGVKASKRLENPLFIASAIAFYSLSFLTLSVNRTPSIDLAITVPVGAVASLINIPLSSYLVKIVPNEIMGRVNSVMVIFLSSGSPVLAVFFGALTEFFPVQTIMLAVAFLIAACTIPTYVAVKRLFTLSESSLKKTIE